MKLTPLLLLLVAVGVAVAGPQRSSRRFTPRRDQEAEPVAADEAAPEADPAEAEEPAKPRFRIAGRPSGSSFAPKRSSIEAPAPSSNDAPAEAAVVAPTPATRAPAQASPARPRTRGSRTFVESIKISNIPLEASQLEVLENSKQSLQRISSRPSSRPSSRVPTSQAAAPAPRTPSRPSSVRAPLAKPSPPTNAIEPETIEPIASPKASASKPSGNNQEQRRQRLLALKKRPRGGASSAPPRAEESLPEEEPAQASSAPVEATEEKMMDKKADSMQDKSSLTKLDEEVTKTLDETIKDEAKQEGEAMKKETAAKETVAEKAEEKMPEEAEPAASAVTPEPEATTTTAAAPTARPRRINTLSKLRASRPVGGSSGGARPRTSAPAAAAAPTGRDSSASEVQPRLSSRRGGRGNSRGGAALATSTRISRPSSRVQASRTPETAGEEAGAGELEAPAAGTTGSSGSFRRKLLLPSRRRNQASLSIRPSTADQKEDDESRVAGDGDRGPRTVRHTLVPDTAQNRPLRAGRSAVPERKQDGTAEKKTRRAGVRSLIERLRGRKTNRMRIDEAQKAREEVAEENVNVKEELNVNNGLTGSQSKSELINSNLAAESTTKSKPVTTTASSLRPRNRSPALLKRRENSKRPDKQRPRGRVERRRRPIKFAAVATAPPPPSTTTEATTLPTPTTTAVDTTTLLTSSTTDADITTLPDADTTTLPTPSTTAETTTVSTSSTDGDTTTLLTPSATTAETTALPTASATAETTTLSTSSSTSVETFTVPPQSSTTAETTTELQQSSTSAQTTTLPSQTSTPTETTTMLLQSSTSGETTTLPPQSTIAPPTSRPRRPLPSIGRTTRQRQSTTTRAPPTTLAATAKPPSPRTTTLRPASTSEREPEWKPRVAPEDPKDAAFNKGGFRFQPHPSSESDITRRRGEVVLTEVGTLEDTPPQQVAAILRGLGGRRRGLARPPAARQTTTTQPAIRDEFSEPDYYYDEY